MKDIEEARDSFRSSTDSLPERQRAKAVRELHERTMLPGTPIPHWTMLTAQLKRAAQVFVGIRTQSWDVALSSTGPVFLS